MVPGTLPVPLLLTDPRDVRRAALALGAALEDEVEQAVGWYAATVALRAKQEHRYTNRTGLLEASTHAIPPSGSFLSGTLSAYAIGATHYGQWVEWRSDYLDRYAYLGPAREFAEPYAVHAFDLALEAAVRKSGWDG